jgi:hypothetical protein
MAKNRIVRMTLSLSELEAIIAGLRALRQQFAQDSTFEHFDSLLLAPLELRFCQQYDDAQC